MRHVYLVRYTKSSWNCPDMDDFDRPLNKRGIRDAPEMERYLAVREIVPKIIATSPEKCASVTAILLATAMRLPSSNVVGDR